MGLGWMDMGTEDGKSVARAGRFELVTFGNEGVSAWAVRDIAQQAPFAAGQEANGWRAQQAAEAVLRATLHAALRDLGGAS